MGGSNSSPSASSKPLSFSGNQTPNYFQAEKPYSIESGHPELIAQGIEKGVKSAGSSITGAVAMDEYNQARKDQINSLKTSPAADQSSVEPNFSETPEELKGVTDKNWMEEILSYLKQNQKQY